VFQEQDAEYRERVLPGAVKARVAVEAGAASLERYVGMRGRVVGKDHFGASAPADVLYREFGLTAENVPHRRAWDGGCLLLEDLSSERWRTEVRKMGSNPLCS
jgi:transketolase